MEGSCDTWVAVTLTLGNSIHSILQHEIWFDVVVVWLEIL